MRTHHFSTVAVVTSNYHMPRTLVELDHALQESERIVPHPVVTEGFDAGAWWRSPPVARLVPSEYVKFPRELGAHPVRGRSGAVAGGGGARPAQADQDGRRAADARVD